MSIEVDKLDPSDPKAFAAALRKAVERWKDQRLDWYLGQMRTRSRLVNDLPAWSAALGVLGVLFTAGAAVARALNLAKLSSHETLDVVLLAIAVVAYALMSAGLLYERLTEGSGGYFRAVGAVVAIRDLWTAYQFADMGRALAPANPDADQEIQRWLVPAQEFCKALDQVVADELTAWRTAYQAAAKLRADTADEGLKAVIGERRTSAEAAADAAATAATHAEEAARSAAGAKAPATLDLSLGSAATAGTAIVKIDGKEVARGVNQRTFSIEKLSQGLHKVRVEFTPSAGGGATSYEKSVDLTARINAVTITVP